LREYESRKRLTGGFGVEEAQSGKRLKVELRGLDDHS
jgi:hypothetical protein